jgi:hypothetical protein
VRSPDVVFCVCFTLFSNNSVETVTKKCCFSTLIDGLGCRNYVYLPSFFVLVSTVKLITPI